MSACSASVELEVQIAWILKHAGKSAEFTVEIIQGGRNNQAYCVCSAGTKFFLKKYFQHPDDPRNRLRQEFDFLLYLTGHGCDGVPEPIGNDLLNQLGLYSFIDGVVPAKISMELLEQTLEFFQDINAERHSAEARSLPPASEACFSVADYFQSFLWRFDQLQSIEPKSVVDRDALNFVQRELAVRWKQVSADIKSAFAKRGVGLEEKIGMDALCLSPSDFGFHNSLLTPSGRLFFVDFEYAGWDDPVKMICDFICHPGMNLPPEYHNRFRDAVVAMFSAPEKLLWRCCLLLKVCRLKWCCIVLNEFLLTAGDRRQFASCDKNPAEQKIIQLDKAKAILDRI